MNAKERIEKMKAIKEAYEKKQAELLRAKRLLEQESPSSLSRLIENDLEQAKLILAAKDVLDRLQKIAEHLAELGAEEIMPLADDMKGAFGPDIAAEFEHTTNDQIQKALETVRAAKDAINSAILKVEGKIPPSNDMTADTGGDDSADAGTLDTDNMADIGPDDTDPATDPEAMGDKTPVGDDDFTGADSAAAADPMGRAKRESVEPKTHILESAGKNLLVKESLNTLMAWLLEDAAAKIKDPEALGNFAKVAVIKANENPEKMAGWIGQKKYGAAAMAQMAKPQISNSAAQSGLNITIESKKEKLARSIAKVIEANVEAFGQGYAARVIEQFIGEDSTGLMEDNDGRTSVLEKFSEIFGMSPGRYSLNVRKKMQEDGQSIPTPPTPPKPPATPGAAHLTPQQKQKANNAVSKLASQVANNPAAGGDSVDNAISGFSTDDQKAVHDLEDNISANNGGEPTNVNDLLKASGNAIGEAGPGGLEMPQGKKGSPMQTDAGKNKAKTGTPKGKPTKKSPSKMQKGSSTPFAQMKGGRNVTEADIEEIEENINAALWPTDPKTGQYKGEPMSTDYGKLKSKTKDNDNTAVADSDTSMPGTKKDPEAKKVNKGTEKSGKPAKNNDKLPDGSGGNNNPGDSEPTEDVDGNVSSGDN